MKQAKKQAIITRDTLRNMLNEATLEKQIQIVGRALVVLFERQTTSEQAANSTDQDNSRGFASCDARGGSLTAKSFIKYRTLQTWQLQKWTNVQANGYPKLCKYHRQLNEAAEEKAAKIAARTGQMQLAV